MSDSSEEESGTGCFMVIVLTIIGTLIGGPIGALFGFGLGILLAENGDKSKTSETAVDKEELTKGGLPYTIAATWNGVANKEAELTIQENRIRLESDSSTQTIPFSSISTVQRTGKNLEFDLIRKDRTTISFPNEETTEVVEEVIFDVL